MSKRLNIGGLFREAFIVLREHYILAAPAVVSLLAFALALSAFLPPPETIEDLIIPSFVSFVITIFAHGVTVAMSREIIERNTTSMRTAALVAQKLFLRLLAASIIMGASVFAGSALFLLPGLAAGFIMMYTMPAMMAGNLGVFESIAKSFDAVKVNVGNSLALYMSIVSAMLGLTLAQLMLISIPVAGQVIGVVLTGALGAVISFVLMKAYRDLQRHAAIISHFTPPHKPNHDNGQDG